MTVAPSDSRQPAGATTPVGDEARSGVDRTLIRWMLSLTPAERLDVLQGFVDSVKELRGEGPRRG
ncbi:MAG TPA: hypothetical protein VKU40_17915 [Thermoanaerobaculia bacterium]|nr:hypothetical protein [Thermoanaerobaculia bacterium]